MEHSSALPRTPQPPIPMEGAILGALPLASAEPPRLRAVQTRSPPHPALQRAPGGLPVNQFLSDLHREMRRADRSRTPLSLLVYRVDRPAIHEPPNADQLLEVLHRVKRETDIVGLVGDDTVAVLCPDTDAAGLLAFLRKVETLSPGPPPVATPATATYPDAMFDSLASGTSPLPAAMPFLVAEGQVRADGGYAGKRALDIVGAALAICLFAPLMLATALAIACTRGPVIFRQTRLGIGGRPFTFYKFRSMQTRADDGIHRAYVASLIGGSVATPRSGTNDTPFKLQDDPRVTWIGRLIRKTSIDELPQLFNVLHGEMSLVGPRPPIPYEAAHYQSWHLRRILSVKPGITGVWQVEGRSRVSFNEMVRMDLRYIRHCSLLLDMKLLFRTVAAVLRCEGAK